MNDTTLTVFVDSVGRTIIGEEVSRNKTSLTVKSPAIIHVVPNPQTGQITVQLLPYFFKEFTKGGVGDADATWTFNLSSLVLAEGVELDEKLVTQYKNVYSPIVTPDSGLVGAGAGAGDGSKVVKLFDD